MDAVRQHSAHSVARADTQASQPARRRRDLAAELVPGDHGGGRVLADSDHRGRGAMAGQGVLGIVHPGCREPPGARHPSVGKGRAVPAVALDRTEVPDRVPEPIKVVHRPLPQGAGVRQRSAAFSSQPVQIGGDPGGTDPLRGWRPQLPSRGIRPGSGIRRNLGFITVSNSHGVRP